jgi:hypothetical protein
MKDIILHTFKFISTTAGNDCKFCNYSVIIFCDYEFFRPVRDDMLVENNVTNYPRPVGMQCW